MRAALRVVEKVTRQNVATAMGGVLTADLVCPRMTPAVLREQQDALRQQLLWVEDRLTALRNRRGRRDVVLRRLHGGTPDQRSARQEHLHAVRLLEAALIRQRSILRQIADTLAWTVLGMEPNVIAPLWVQNGQFLPRGIGLGGQVLVSHTLLRSEQFLSLETDLTRCLGVGDLVVVPVGEAWRVPLVIELKSKGTMAVGETVSIVFHSALSDDAVLQRTYQGVQDVLSLGAEPLPELANLPEPPRTARQRDQMMARAEMLDRLTEGLFVQTGPPPRRLLKPLANVLSRGLDEDECWDIPERGVAYVAIRVLAGSPKERTRQIIDRLRDEGFGDGYRVITSDDFRGRDEMATLIPPIAHWPFSRRVRASLLTGDLFFACIVGDEVWASAVRARGMEFESSDDGWLIRLGERSVLFDKLSIGRVTLGLPFAGVSPQQLAEEIQRLLESDHGDEVEGPAKVG